MAGEGARPVSADTFAGVSADTFVGVPAGPAGGGVRMIGVAIPVPEPYGTELQRTRAAYGDPLADAIPTHITLMPPTEVAPGEIAAIEAHLLDVAHSERPFRIRLRGSGTFRPVSPVVYVALAKGIGGCERVQAKVASGPLARPLPFPYHPHITIAHHLPDDVMDRAYKDMSGYRAEFEAWGFSLYEHGLDGVWRPQCDFVFGNGKRHSTFNG